MLKPDARWRRTTALALPKLLRGRQAGIFSASQFGRRPHNFTNVRPVNPKWSFPSARRQNGLMVEKNDSAPRAAALTLAASRLGARRQAENLSLRN